MTCLKLQQEEHDGNKSVVKARIEGSRDGHNAIQERDIIRREGGNEYQKHQGEVQALPNKERRSNAQRKRDLFVIGF